MDAIGSNLINCTQMALGQGNLQDAKLDLTCLWAYTKFDGPPDSRTTASISRLEYANHAIILLNNFYTNTIHEKALIK